MSLKLERMIRALESRVAALEEEKGNKPEAYCFAHTREVKDRWTESPGDAPSEWVEAAKKRGRPKKQNDDKPA